MTKKIPAVLKQIRNGGASYNFANWSIKDSFEKTLNLVIINSRL